jgi:Predicted membrane protein
MAALIFICTAFFNIPLGFGYVHLGDGIIFAASSILGPIASFSAAVGSSLADLASGFNIYAPVTFFIKGIMCFIAAVLLKKFGNKFTVRLLIFILCEIFMSVCYMSFEVFIYGTGAIITNLISSACQGTFGVIIGVILYPVTLRLKKFIFS